MRRHGRRPQLAEVGGVLDLMEAMVEPVAAAAAMLTNGAAVSLAARQGTGLDRPRTRRNPPEETLAARRELTVKSDLRAGDTSAVSRGSPSPLLPVAGRLVDGRGGGPSSSRTATRLARRCPGCWRPAVGVSWHWQLATTEASALLTEDTTSR
jgi:hypothetical protein